MVLCMAERQVGACCPAKWQSQLSGETPRGSGLELDSLDRLSRLVPPCRRILSLRARQPRLSSKIRTGKPLRSAARSVTAPLSSHNPSLESHAFCACRHRCWLQDCSPLATRAPGRDHSTSQQHWLKHQHPSHIAPVIRPSSDASPPDLLSEPWRWFPTHHSAASAAASPLQHLRQQKAGRLPGSPTSRGRF